MFMEMEDDAAVWTIETIIKLKKVIKRNIWFICIIRRFIFYECKYISRKEEEKEKKKDSIIFINGTRDSSRSRL